MAGNIVVVDWVGFEPTTTYVSSAVAAACKAGILPD